MRIKLLNTKKPQNSAELESILLTNRQITDPETFFSPPQPAGISPEDVGISVDALHHATKVIQETIAAHKKIVIFGDYDADGICATATLWKCLQSAGAQVFPFIPDRQRHGYGLTTKGIDDLILQYHPDLIITVDNGIVAHEAITYATEQGIAVIISDHHQKEFAADGSELPTSALAIVHTTALCGTTVAWMLGRSIHADAAADSLDLCAVATLADQVPLKDYNRAFAFHGLAALRETTRPGLLALFQLAHLEQETLTEQDISFGIAPRINAMGRLSHGLDALRLLCTSQLATAEKLAMRLQETNTERQDLTKEQFEEASEQVRTQMEEHVLVVHSESFHEGVIGLIASKLTEKFHKPSIVIAMREVVAKGSARSVAGVNITDLLRSVRSELLEVGGHPMAGGFSISVDRITVFKELLFSKARLEIAPEALVHECAVECVLPFALCTVETVHQIEKFAPFGAANRKPLFLIENVYIQKTEVLGKERQHLKLQLSAETGDTYTALWWKAGHQQQEFLPGTIVSAVTQLDVNVWKGRQTVQLILKDLTH